MTTITIENGKCALKTCYHRHRCSLADGNAQPMLAGIICSTEPTGEFLLEEISPVEGEQYLFIDAQLGPQVVKCDAINGNTYAVTYNSGGTDVTFCVNKLYKMT